MVLAGMHASCAPPGAEALEGLPRHAHPAAASRRRDVQLAPMPDLGPLPVLAGGPAFPWPLTGPPSLLPHAPEAAACGVRKSPRVGEAAYAQAWCGDLLPEARLEALAQLAPQAPRALAAAILADEADLLADQWTMPDALRWLNVHAASPALYDRYAGTLAALDRPVDARYANAHLPAVTDPETMCERGLRVYALGGSWDAHLTANGAPRCAEELALYTCSRAMTEHLHSADDGLCVRYMRAHPAEAPAIAFTLLARAWPSGAGSFRQWLWLVDQARTSLGLPHAEDFAIAALQNASLFAGCNDDRSREVRVYAAALLAAPGHDPARAPALFELSSVLPATCVPAGVATED